MSTEQEIEALDALCQRMAGFEDSISLEWLDGYMSALAAGPRRLTLLDWLPVFGEGVFTRTFADPADVEAAQEVIQARWDVLANQLDPEQILEDPDVLRLAPLMIELSDEDKAQLVADGHVKEDELHLLEQTGEVWAIGFIDATRDFPQDWPEADLETEEGQLFDECMLRVVSLTLDPEELKEVFEELYEGEELTRDELIHEALYAAQDMRLYWLDHAPKPPQRRVGELPGRNDPCPCGSGKKFKKCHGAQVQ
ncbi:UPF0149 family protein [Ideonella azotifigens]|nr:UPF0149 family protein [Ideonella azotifigens]MCD2343702.1 UPF0149 family protein [Ideonella azotifigens]